MTMLTPSLQPKTLLVVDALESVRDGINDKFGATTDICVVGQAYNWVTALAEIERLTPDIVLLDAQIDGGAGLDLAKQLATTHAGLTVVLHTTTDLTDEQFSASGATAVVLKQLIGGSLLDTLRKVATELSGDPYADANRSDR